MPAGTILTEAQRLEAEAPGAITEIINRKEFDKSPFINMCFTQKSPTLRDKISIKDMEISDRILNAVANSDIEHNEFKLLGHEIADIPPYYFKEKTNVKNTDFNVLPYAKALNSEFSAGEVAMQLYAYAAFRMGMAIRTVQEKMAIDAIVHNEIEWQVKQASGTFSPIKLATNMPAANRKVIASGDHWKEPATKPFDDIDDWYRTIKEAGGATPRYVFMSPDIATAFKRNPSVLDRLDRRRYEGAQFNPRSIADAHMRYIGYCEGLEYYEYTNFYKALDANLIPTTVTRMLPTGSLIMAPDKSDDAGGVFYARIERDDANVPMVVHYIKVPNLLEGTHTVGMNSNFVVAVTKPDSFMYVKFNT